MSWSRIARYPIANLAQDLRNHGDSDHHPRHDYTALAQDVEGFIDEHKLGAVTLIGHSMYAYPSASISSLDLADE